MSRPEELLQRKVNMLTARGVVQATNDAGGAHRVQVRVTPRETIDDVPVMQLYGLASHAKPSSEAMLLFVAGDRSRAVAVATNDPGARPRNQQPGEVTLYTDEGDTITLGRGHQITITTTGTVTIKAHSIQVQGDITCTGTITANTINAPNGHVGP